MLLFLKKKTDDAEKKPEKPPTSEPIPAAEFLPYYCHYNPHTLLTKNGELMQIIRIAHNLRGLDYESGEGAATIVRQVIRQAIMESVHSDKFALWVHTIRKRRPVRYSAKFKESFAAYIYEKWKQKNRWKYQYYNEIYVTVLYEGQGAKMLDKDHLSSVFLPRRNRQFRNAYLDVVYEELETTVTGLLRKICAHYKADRLSVVERIPPKTEIAVNQAIFYSEPMEFLGTLLNLRQESFPLSDIDLSSALVTTAQTFGFNALETKNDAGKRRFGAILTLKQYREVPPETVDRLLQAPMEFIVTQTFHFVPRAGALKQYKEQKDIFDVSGDFYCIEASGIEDMMSSNTNNPTDFGEHQTSIMVLSDDFKQLDGEISKVQSAFADLGLITIREDLKLEECFWSQLPGNFEFIRRRDTINTSRVGGFCRLNRFPSGNESGNHWGDAVTLLPTLVGSPYFFNFHHQDKGHTVVFDFNSFHDSTGHVLCNFLLSETLKYNGRLYLFDRDQSAQLFFDKLGAKYHSFPATSRAQQQATFRLNPFALEDTPRNRSFLQAWCLSLLEPGTTLDEDQKTSLRTAIDQLYTGEATGRNLMIFTDHLAVLDVALAKRFTPWHPGGNHGGLFDGESDTLDLKDMLHGFDMDSIITRPECIIPMFSYLLHRIVTGIDGRPTIIVLHEAWDLLENAFIAPRLESLMEMLQQHNAIFLFTTTKPFDRIDTRSFSTIMKHCATRIYLPDDIVRNYAAPQTADAMGLKEADAKMLLKMDRQKGDFLLKQNNETIALRADIKDLDDVYAVLSNDVKNLAAVLGKFTATDG